MHRPFEPQAGTSFNFQMPVTPENMQTIYSKLFITKLITSLHFQLAEKLSDQFNVEEYCEMRKVFKTQMKMSKM